jgi:hypothetical protein
MLLNNFNNNNNNNQINIDNNGLRKNILLDICSGTGTIGIVLKKLNC